MPLLLPAKDDGCRAPFPEWARISKPPGAMSTPVSSLVLISLVDDATRALGRPTPAGGVKEGGRPLQRERPAGVPPTTGRSGRSPAEPSPPGGAKKDTSKGQRRPVEDHPWRKPFQRKKGQPHDTGHF